MAPEIHVISFGVVRPEVDSPGFPSAQRAIGEKPGGLQHILQGPALDITEIRRQRIGCPGRELFERVGEVLSIAFDSDLVPHEALEAGEEVGKVQVAAGVFGRFSRRAAAARVHGLARLRAGDVGSRSGGLDATAMSEDEAFEQGIGAEAVGAVDSRTGRLSRGQEAGNAGAAVGVRGDPADGVVRAGPHGDRLAEDVDTEASAELEYSRETLPDAFRGDGAEIKPHDRFVFKSHLLEDVPNLAWSVGYTNASWTLRADMTARAVAKLLRYMRTHGYTHAYPHLGEVSMPAQPLWDLKAGYVLRAPEALPKSGTHGYWKVRHNYYRDAIDHHTDDIEKSMVFGRAPAAAPSA